MLSPKKYMLCCIFYQTYDFTCW